MKAENEKPKKCNICNQEKSLLPQTTSKKGLPVYVCTKSKGKAKAPCDGPVFELATKNL